MPVQSDEGDGGGVVADAGAARSRPSPESSDYPALDAVKGTASRSAGVTDEAESVVTVARWRSQKASDYMTRSER